MLAIVIPYYKLTFFEATLQSLADQTEKRFKVYIGDDASPTNPSALLREYKGKFDFEYHRFGENIGGTSLVQQWDRCIALVEQEEWIMILGDDDVLSDNCIETFYKNEINNKNVNVVRYSTIIIDEYGGQISEVYLHPKLEKASHFLYRKLTGETRSSLGEYVFKKTVLLDKGFHDFPLGWHSDDMAVLECSNFNTVYTINEAIVFIRVSGMSISGREDNIALKKQAMFLFCYSLAAYYSKYFTIRQRLKIIGKVEQIYFKKRSIKLFLQLSIWHIRQTGLINFLKFLRRIYIVKKRS